MDVVLLMYDGCSGWGITGAHEILHIANQSYMYYNNQHKPLLNVTIASSKKTKTTSSTGIEIKAQEVISNIKKCDLIFIPGTTCQIDKIIRENPEMIKWIKNQYQNGAKIITYCTGTFILAATGLLEGKNAVTHWFQEEKFKCTYPDINLLSHKVLMHEDNLFLGGGGASYQNLLLYVIEKTLGKNVFLFTSKILLLDMEKESQSAYSFFQSQKQHNDKEILLTQNFIETNFKLKHSLQNLSDIAGMSERSFLRRFKNATGNTPIQYIQRVKIEQSKKMLEEENKTFEEISRELGYEDISSFRKLFKKITGITPSKYKEKYCFIT